MVNRLPVALDLRLLGARAAVAALGVIGFALDAAAAETRAEATLAVDGPLPAASAVGERAPDAGAVLVGAEVGGIVPLNGPDPFVSGGLELGWIFAGTEQRIAALLEVTYTAPSGSGRANDARLPGGTFDWDIAQKELILQPTFLYRYTALGPIVPFAGIGPRIYFLETVAEASASGVEINESKERSTQLGAGLPLGAEYSLGPGGVMAKLLLEWAPLDHRVTGDTSLLATSLFVGYRARL